MKKDSKSMLSITEEEVKISIEIAGYTNDKLQDIMNEVSRMASDLPDDRKFFLIRLACIDAMRQFLFCLLQGLSFGASKNEIAIISNERNHLSDFKVNFDKFYLQWIEAVEKGDATGLIAYADGVASFLSRLKDEDEIES